jgi:hypothetical protein
MRLWISLVLGIFLILIITLLIFHIKFMRIWDQSTVHTAVMEGRNYEMRVFKWNRGMATFSMVYGLMLSYKIWKDGYLVGPVSAGGYESEVTLYKEMVLTNR